MPRRPRVVIPGCPHHVSQRGNNRQDVFFVDDDRRLFLNLLTESAARFGLAVECYCLMTNHYHLLAVPRDADSLHLTLKRVNQLYAQRINWLHGRSGHLWQSRFYSCPLDRRHSLATALYVERNPLRAGLVKQPWQWAWSSAAAHCGQPDPFGLLAMDGLRPTPAEWRKLLGHSQDTKMVKEIRLCTSRGRPLGDDSFVAKLETRVGRRLRPLPRGRPEKRKK